MLIYTTQFKLSRATAVPKILEYTNAVYEYGILVSYYGLATPKWRPTFWEYLD